MEKDETMFIVKTRFFETLNKGMPMENRRPEWYFRENGPFATRDAAEAFATNIAKAQDICEVLIKEVEE